MMPDIMSGQVPIGVISALAANGPTKAGRIRTLAVTIPKAVDHHARVVAARSKDAGPTVRIARLIVVGRVRVTLVERTLARGGRRGIA